MTLMLLLRMLVNWRWVTLMLLLLRLLIGVMKVIMLLVWLMMMQVTDTSRSSRTSDTGTPTGLMTCNPARTNSVLTRINMYKCLARVEIWTVRCNVWLCQIQGSLSINSKLCTKGLDEGASM